MRCIKCNYDNLDGMKYCVSCGSELLTPEQKAKKAEANKKSVVKLYVVIGILVVLLIGLIVFLLVGNGGSNGSAGGNNGGDGTVSVHPDTVGIWNCNSDPKASSFTLTIELNNDGTYLFGPYGNTDSNNISGTFSSNSFGATDETGKYDLYSLTLTQKQIKENGTITEGEATVSYSIGISSDKNSAIFTNGATSTSYYCKK